jgi:hypothetical protein
MGKSVGGDAFTPLLNEMPGLGNLQRRVATADAAVQETHDWGSSTGSWVPTAMKL